MASCEDVSDTKFPTGQETVSFLATEMAKLNAQQISEALEDLHGVSSFKPVAETPQLVQIKFAEFESKISKNKNKAYKMAEDISKKYVQNPDLRIRYLRCESYDVCKAVARFMSMFEQKLLYFGPSLLAQDIRLSDLSKDEIKILESGMIQELDQTDSSGRTVVVFLKELHPLVEGVDKYVSKIYVLIILDTTLTNSTQPLLMAL